MLSNRIAIFTKIIIRATKKEVTIIQFVRLAKVY